MPVTASISVDHSEVQSGMPINVTVTFTNATGTDRSITLATRQSPPRDAAFDTSSSLVGVVIPTGSDTPVTYQLTCQAPNPGGENYEVTPQFVLDNGTSVIPGNTPVVRVLNPLAFEDEQPEQLPGWATYDFASNDMSYLLANGG